MSNCHKFACLIPSLHSCGSSWPSRALGHFHIISTKHSPEKRSVRDGDECVDMHTVCRVQKDTYFQIKKIENTFRILPLSCWKKPDTFFSGLYFLGIKHWISAKIQKKYLHLSPSHTQACGHMLIWFVWEEAEAAEEPGNSVLAKHTLVFLSSQLSPVKWLKPLMNFYAALHESGTLNCKNFCATSNSSTTKGKHFDKCLQECTRTWGSW